MKKVSTFVALILIFSALSGSVKLIPAYASYDTTEEMQQSETALFIQNLCLESFALQSSDGSDTTHHRQTIKELIINDNLFELISFLSEKNLLIISEYVTTSITTRGMNETVNREFLQSHRSTSGGFVMEQVSIVRGSISYGANGLITSHTQPRLTVEQFMNGTMWTTWIENARTSATISNGNRTMTWNASWSARASASITGIGGGSVFNFGNHSVTHRM